MPKGKIFTQDIKDEWGNWLNIVRRLQAECHKQEGLAIATFRVVLKSDGTPLLWTSPRITKLEPKNKIAGEHLETLTAIFGDGLLEVLEDE